jgi:hypothetical protein
MTKEWDDMSKALASGVPRRKALWMVGSAVLGGIVLRGPFKAFAQGGGNSVCAHWCVSVFGADTPEANLCISDAAHGAGACYDCGPLGNNTGVCGGTCCPQGTTPHPVNGGCICCAVVNGTLICL